MSINFNEYKDMVDLTALSNFCRDNGKLCHYAKGETIVRQGSVGKYFGVIESGYFKYMTITTDGDETVVGFAFEGECVCDFNNSFRGIPSEVAVVAGCETDVWQVSFKTIKDLIETRLNSLHDSITDVLFREIYHRYLEIYRKSPTERYLQLLTHHPDIFEIVTMREVASYLLVTPVYLSRIRKNSLKKQANKTCFIPKPIFLPNFANQLYWQMDNRILKSILILTVIMPFVAFAELNGGTRDHTHTFEQIKKMMTPVYSNQIKQWKPIDLSQY